MSVAPDEIRTVGNAEVTWSGSSLTDVFSKETLETLSAMGDRIVDEAKRIVPVRTGRLKASIHKEDNFEKSEVLVGSEVEYALYVELGTYKMSARPYLRPALHTVASSQLKVNTASDWLRR